MTGEKGYAWSWGMGLKRADQIFWKSCYCPKMALNPSVVTSGLVRICRPWLTIIPAATTKTAGYISKILSLKI
jgi:hypothetical protein